MSAAELTEVTIREVVDQLPPLYAERFDRRSDFTPDMPSDLRYVHAVDIGFTGLTHEIPDPVNSGKVIRLSPHHRIPFYIVGENEDGFLLTRPHVLDESPSDFEAERQPYNNHGFYEFNLGAMRWARWKHVVQHQQTKQAFETQQNARRVTKLNPAILVHKNYHTLAAAYVSKVETVTPAIVENYEVAETLQWLARDLLRDLV